MYFMINVQSFPVYASQHKQLNECENNNKCKLNKQMHRERNTTSSDPMETDMIIIYSPPCKKERQKNIFPNVQIM